MTEEIKEILDTPMFITDNEGFTIYINNKIENYITNLQKENMKLISENETIKNIKYTVDETIYKSRNEKAVEYIENDLQISVLPNNQIINGTEVIKRINKIVNILQGGDE